MRQDEPSAPPRSPPNNNNNHNYVNVQYTDESLYVPPPPLYDHQTNPFQSVQNEPEMVFSEEPPPNHPIFVDVDNAVHFLGEKNWAHSNMYECCQNEDEINYCCYVTLCTPCAIADIRTLEDGNFKKWRNQVIILIFISILLFLMGMVFHINFGFVVLMSNCFIMYRGVQYLSIRYGITTLPQNFWSWFCCQIKNGPVCGFCYLCHLYQVGMQLQEDPGPVSEELILKIRENNCFGKAFMVDRFLCC